MGTIWDDINVQYIYNAQTPFRFYFSVLFSSGKPVRHQGSQALGAVARTRENCIAMLA